MSFLQQFKSHGARAEKKMPSSDEETAVDKIAQLDVDVFQAKNLIVVYAQVPGADIHDLHVTIEGDADIVLIEGRHLRPEYLAFHKKKPKGAFFTEECLWGDFYRRIILPESVDIDHAEAKIKNGVLVLVLPLLKSEEKKKVQLKITKERRSRRVA